MGGIGGAPVAAAHDGHGVIAAVENEHADALAEMEDGEEGEK